MMLKKIGLKLSIVAMAIIAAVVVLALFLIKSETNNLVSNMLEAQSKTTNNAFAQTFTRYQEQALERAEMIAGSAEVISAVENRDHERLLKALQNFSVGVDLITLCDAEGNVLARTHNDKTGDSVLSQEAISVALSTGKGIKTIEPGTVIGLSTRGSAAIKDGGGKIIGALIAAITDEIEKVVRVSHGHAAIMFTSYNTMGRVYTALKNRLPFPMFRLDKGGILEIERFKQSGNGVLFASGAMWEGVDIQGHTLSLVVVVKLPFSFPDFISEYERSQYESKADYMKHVIRPDCLIKARQVHGRVFRSEKDTGAVVFCDCRLAESGAHRNYFLSGLPHCRVTSDILDLEDFYRAVKPPEYFE